MILIKGQDLLMPDDLYFPFEDYQTPMIVKDIYNNQIVGKDTTAMRERAFKFIQQHHSAKVRMENTIKLIEGKTLDIIEDFNKLRSNNKRLNSV